MRPLSFRLNRLHYFTPSLLNRKNMNDNVKSPWPGPVGMIPVTSGKADDANVFNRNYLDSIHVEMRVIDAIEPSLKTVIFGEEFDSPIMMPAFSHLNKVLKDGKKPMLEYARAAKKLNTVNWLVWSPTTSMRK